MPSDPVDDFIVAACVPLEGGHSSGTLDRANSILAAQAQLASLSIYTAAILGDEPGVRRFLDRDRTAATAKGGPHDWDPLTHLCFSRYLRLEPSRSAGFVSAARALLDAGASANTGFYCADHQPNPGFESVLYGAAGVAHHPELTRLLLERGANPNDEEVPYHAPEGWDNRAVTILVLSGKLNPDSLATMLLRKADWHDLEGVNLLLEHSANPNAITRWGKSGLHQAVMRDNSLEIIEALMDYGADPLLKAAGTGSSSFEANRSALSMAARRGRKDVLNLFERRGVSLRFEGVEALIVACARGDAAQAQSLASAKPMLLAELILEGGRLLAEFAGNGNTEGVRNLLNLGVAVDARYLHGDGYFGIAPNSTPLHVAAWRARPGTVRLLIERGAAVNATDAKGNTPLALAVRACVDSYWKERRSPESVQVLLQAGASVANVPYPCGYQAVDDLLKAARA